MSMSTLIPILSCCFFVTVIIPNSTSGGGERKSGCFKCDEDGHKKANCPNPTLVVSNLEETVTKKDLSDLFGDIGKVRKVNMKVRGVAEIVFVKREDAEKAVEKYDHK